MNYKGTCSVNSNGTHYSCFNEKTIKDIKKLWNQKYQRKKITEEEPQKIWESLRDNMKKTCKNERCWLKKKFISKGISNDIYNYTFAPDAPVEWEEEPEISNLDIDDLMQHYEKKYNYFNYLGPTPINFDEKDENGDYVWEELYFFDIKNYLKKGIKKIGIIFNTDTYGGEGQHWISMMIDISKEPYIFFFDSLGNNPPKQVKQLVSKIIQQFKELNIDIPFYTNKVRHQKKSDECGMYCIYMITKLVDDSLKYTDFCKKPFLIKDSKMTELRDLYFNM